MVVEEKEIIITLNLYRKDRPTVKTTEIIIPIEVQQGKTRDEIRKFFMGDLKKADNLGELGTALKNILKPNVVNELLNL